MTAGPDRRRDDEGRDAAPTHLQRDDNQRPRGALATMSPGDGSSSWDLIVAEFIERWEHGESPPVEDYLARLEEPDPDEAVELIYHEYCLAESAGLNPNPADYLKRFPSQQEVLARLFRLHGLFDSKVAAAQAADRAELPEAGDEIGPYALVRELGRGAFARVFLAEQVDLDRLVVLKVSTRITPEARLLARARHPHIVEILNYATVDAGRLQLLCMPFLGGATLGAVLDERRHAGQPPKSGRDLLADLDRVSSREYTVANRTRPARELMARLSYAQAVAWIVARLAEALDHALVRGVAHGDVKPSNVLIAADGTPMLLDFNLAIDGRSDLEAAAGGTLAYMAPERLADLLAPAPGTVARRGDRHRADIYSLGLVLLEALTGQLWPGSQAPAVKSPREIAGDLMERRRQGAETLLREVRAPLPRGLRSILGRCLAAEPTERYLRAAELAEDLDRWRGDRAPVHAPDVPRAFRLARWARRQARALTALALCLAIGVSSGAIVWNTSRASLRAQALAKLDQYWGSADPNIYRFGNTAQWRTIDPAPLAEQAQRNLNLYGVLEADNWRQRDDVRTLPDGDRLDLEAWLLEQAFRLAQALADRPDSPQDWKRALTVLDKAGGDLNLRAFEALRQRLNDQRARFTSRPPPADRPHARKAPEWMEEYLLGVAAEGPRVLEARAHYRKALALRPETYWADYRAAAATFRLRDPGSTVAHLRRCLARRPRNAALHSQLVGSLVDLDRLPEALGELEIAERLEPDLKDIYRIRTPLWARLGQEERVQADLRRLEILTRGQDKGPAWEARLLSGLEAEHATGRADDVIEAARRLLETEPGDARVRDDLGLFLARSGREWEALDELSKVVEADPEHLLARYHRVLVLISLKRDEADDELDYIFAHPRLEELLRVDPLAVQLFRLASDRALRQGRHAAARELAARGLDYARQLKVFEGDLHYDLARACAAETPTHRERLAEAVDHLGQARRLLPPGRLDAMFENDRVFDDVRPRIRPLLTRVGR
jgi:serine/threonine protein kinase/predicted Zn-dependent protease